MACSGYCTETKEELQCVNGTSESKNDQVPFNVMFCSEWKKEGQRGFQHGLYILCNNIM